MQQKIPLRIDISNDNINPFKVTQYDNMARALEITLINNGIAFTDYTGVTSIVVAFKKNDNKCVTQIVEIPQNGQAIIVPLKAQTLSTVGVIYGQISLLGANQEKLGTGKFVGTVGEDLAQNAIESSNDWGDLQKAIYIAQHADEWKLNESNRKTNEDLRIQNENTRIANERERDVSFKQSQLQHENAFEASETARQNTFNNNEAERASNDVQLRNQMAELLKVTGATGTAETELLGAHVDKSGKVYANIGARFDNLDNDKLTSLETDVSLTKLNSVVDGNLIVDRVQGRTLVNLVDLSKTTLSNTTPTTSPFVKSVTTVGNMRLNKGILPFKPNTLYTIVLNIKTNTLNKSVEVLGKTNGRTPFDMSDYVISQGTTGIVCIKARTVSDFTSYTNDLYLWHSTTEVTGDFEFSLMILEGEITNLPSYFTGMKSVGEDNGNKIEISTCGKNLINPKLLNGILNTSVVEGVVTQTSLDTTDILSWKVQKYNGDSYAGGFGKIVNANSGRVVFEFNYNGAYDQIRFGLNGNTKDFLVSYKVNQLSVGTTYTLSFDILNNVQGKVSWGNITLKEGVDNSYLKFQGDKSEILLSAPLHKFDYVTKDGVHHKKSGKTVFDGSDDEAWDVWMGTVAQPKTVTFLVPIITGIRQYSTAFCDRMKYFVSNSVLDKTDEEGINIGINSTYIRVLKSKLSGWADSLPNNQKTALLKTFLKTNPITVVYETTTETIEPLNESLILSSFKDGYFGINSGAINPVVSLSFPTTIGGRVDSLEESNYQLKKDYYSTLKTLIKTADDCLKLELSKQNKTDNNLTTTDKTVVGSINELKLKTDNLDTDKVDKVNGKGLSTNDYDNTEKGEVAKVKELEKYIESLQNDIIPPSMTTNKYRYVKCSATGNSHNLNYVSYSEVKVLDGDTNIAFGCPVIDVVGTVETGIIGYVTDGKSQKDDADSCVDLSTASTQLGSVTVDLGFPQSFQKIIVYHWVGNSRKYTNVKVEVSLDKSKWITLFNSATDGGDYVEDYEGKTVEVPQNDINEVIKYNNYCTERLPDNKSNKLRVATFNMHGDNYLNFDVYKNYVAKNLLHFIGLQEVETTKGAIESKFNIYDLNKVVYGKSNTVDVYNAIHSNRSLETPVVTNLPGTGEGRILVKSSTILNGKKVSLYVTHLSYTEASNRPLQMAKIKEIMDADTTTYKILMGDFNATANDFYNLLGTNYTSVQGYNGQWHETNLDDAYKSIDNIFVTKNITINKVVLNPNMMGSDHRMLWAELTLN